MIESNDHKQNLIKFAEKYRNVHQSFPQDKDGNPNEKYLQYISLLYDPHMIKIALEIDIFPNTTSVVKLAKRLGMIKKELLYKLDPIFKRGAILKVGPRLTLPISLLMYDLPFVLKENYSIGEVKEMARLTREFFEEGYYKFLETDREGVPITRVLTVSEEIEDPKEIVPIEEVYNILDKNEIFALFDCPCRRRREIEGIRECNYPIHTCLAFGPYGKALLELGDPSIKQISKEEAKRITKEVAEIGLVHTIDNHAENCKILCGCCECCCSLLTGLIKFDNPRAFAKANYFSQVDEELCIGCETCLGRCKFGAISIDENAKVNIDKCVGCGLCAITCPEDAIKMKRLVREVIPGLK